ncbi:MAG: dihydrofolate reductase [Clostridiales bacterium]|nr:dihydrofolate reductase [Clostridiales bacterium]
MNAIVAVDFNWAIGNKGELLVSIPKDHKTFREMTSKKVVVLGRKTLSTFPSGLPLVNRTNIILTTDKNFSIKDAITCNSVEEVLESVKQHKSEDVFIIGGTSIYKQFLPYCDTVHVTKIDYKYEADSYFPNLDEMPEWEIVEESDEETYFDLEYTFLKYQRVGVNTP